MALSCCGHKYVRGESFCKRCSTSLTEAIALRRCERCHTNNDGDARFCVHCGEPVETSNMSNTSQPFLFLPEVSYEFEDDPQAGTYTKWISEFVEKCRADDVLVCTADDFSPEESVENERKRHMRKSEFVLIPLCRYICTQFTLSTLTGNCDGKTIYLKPPKEVEPSPNHFKFFFDAADRTKYSCLTSSDLAKTVARIRTTLQDKLRRSQSVTSVSTPDVIANSQSVLTSGVPGVLEAQTYDDAFTPPTTLPHFDNGLESTNMSLAENTGLPSEPARGSDDRYIDRGNGAGHGSTATLHDQSPGAIQGSVPSENTLLRRFNSAHVPDSSSSDIYPGDIVRPKSQRRLSQENRQDSKRPGVETTYRDDQSSRPVTRFKDTRRGTADDAARRSEQQLYSRPTNVEGQHTEHVLDEEANFHQQLRSSNSEFAHSAHSSMYSHVDSTGDDWIIQRDVKEPCTYRNKELDGEYFKSGKVHFRLQCERKDHTDLYKEVSSVRKNLLSRLNEIPKERSFCEAHFSPLLEQYKNSPAKLALICQHIGSAAMVCMNLEACSKTLLSTYMSIHSCLSSINHNVEAWKTDPSLLTSILKATRKLMMLLLFALLSTQDTEALNRVSETEPDIEKCFSRLNLVIDFINDHSLAALSVEIDTISNLLHMLLELKAQKKILEKFKNIETVLKDGVEDKVQQLVQNSLSKAAFPMKCVFLFVSCTQWIKGPEYVERTRKLFLQEAVKETLKDGDRKAKHQRVLLIFEILAALTQVSTNKAALEENLRMLQSEKVKSEKRRGDQLQQRLAPVVSFAVLHFDPDIRAQLFKLIATSKGSKVELPNEAVLNDVITGCIKADLLCFGFQVDNRKTQKQGHLIRIRGKLAKQNVSLCFETQSSCNNSNNKIVREIKLLAKLQHSGKHVVRLLTYVEDSQNFPYYVIREPVERCTLEEKLFQMARSPDQIGLQSRLHFSQQIVDVVSYCNSLKVLLRNVSPAVFLVDEREQQNPTIQLFDLSLARESTSPSSLEYLGKRDEALPLLLLAPESLLTNTYNAGTETYSAALSVMSVLRFGSAPFPLRQYPDLHTCVVQVHKFKHHPAPSPLYPVDLHAQLVEFLVSPKPIADLQDSILKWLQMPPIDYDVERYRDICNTCVHEETCKLSKIPPSLHEKPTHEDLFTEEDCKQARSKPLQQAKANDTPTLIEKMDGKFKWRCPIQKKTDQHERNEILLRIRNSRSSGERELGEEFWAHVEKVLKHPLSFIIHTKASCSLIKYMSTTDVSQGNRLKIYEQIAHACNFLHRKGFIVSCLLPSEILINERNQQIQLGGIHRVSKLVPVYNRQPVREIFSSVFEVIPKWLVRRCPIEVLESGLFTVFSDAYSFGILLLEMERTQDTNSLRRGQPEHVYEPLSHVPYDKNQILKQLRECVEFPKPQCTDEEFYSTYLVKLLSVYPTARPLFNESLEKLSHWDDRAYHMPTMHDEWNRSEEMINLDEKLHRQSKAILQLKKQSG